MNLKKRKETRGLEKDQDKKKSNRRKKEHFENKKDIVLPAYRSTLFDINIYHGVLLIDTET